MANAADTKPDSKPLPAAGNSGNGGSAVIEFSRLSRWVLDCESKKETLRIAKIHTTDVSAPETFQTTFSHPFVVVDNMDGYSVEDGGFYKFPG